jgi:hypothetical protein
MSGDPFTTITFVNVPVGVLPIRPIRVLAATGATNIVACV